MTHRTAIKSSLAVVSCKLSQVGARLRGNIGGLRPEAAAAGVPAAAAAAAAAKGIRGGGGGGGGRGRLKVEVGIEAALAQKSCVLSAKMESRFCC